MASVTLPRGFLTSPAALIAGPDAIGLHFRALFWSVENATNGVLPTAALAMLSGSQDAVMRLVAAGLWAQTAEGWSVGGDHARHVSAVRSAAGRKGADVTNARRQNRQTDRQPSGSDSAPAEPPRTVHARPSESSDGSESRRETTTTLPSTVEAPTRKVAVAVPLNPEGKRLFTLMSREAKSAFDYHCPKALRIDLANRMAVKRLDDATVVVMARLIARPKSVWPWSNALGDGPVTVAWLLGRVTNGQRDGQALAQLVAKARSVVAAEKRNAEARQNLAAAIQRSAEQGTGTRPTVEEIRAAREKVHRARIGLAS